MLTKALEELKQLELELFALGHAMGILSYDGVTCAPKTSAVPREKTMGVLSEMEYRVLVNDRVKDLLAELNENRESLNDIQKKEVSELSDRLRRTTCIPAKEYAAYASLVTKASDVWHESKKNSDFASFLPYLEKIVETNIRFAAYRAPDKDPYDAVLDEYEKGACKKDLDLFFSRLQKELTPLVLAIGKCPAPKDIEGVFPIEKQRVFSERLMRLMGLPKESCIIGETEHPFTDDASKWDVRITTHYHEDQVLSSMYSVIHEGGHALYELGVADELQFTCLGGGSSMGVHESQSRFYENIIGRSRAFVHMIYPVMRECFPAEMTPYSEEDLYRAVNRAMPSLIRTEADELTYPMHVMVRYELEKALFDGSLCCRDLPGEWNRLYKQYLGVDVPNDREGVLQDSHWSGGALGYFPSYALGSAYGAQMLSCMKKTVDVDGCVAAGDLTPVTAWLRDRIHRYGRLLDPADLCRSAFDGAAFDPGAYIRYLTDKFTAIYALK